MKEMKKAARRREAEELAIFARAKLLARRLGVSDWWFTDKLATFARCEIDRERRRAKRERKGETK